MTLKKTPSVPADIEEALYEFHKGIDICKIVTLYLSVTRYLYIHLLVIHFRVVKQLRVREHFPQTVPLSP